MSNKFFMLMLMLTLILIFGSVVSADTELINPEKTHDEAQTVQNWKLKESSKLPKKIVTESTNENEGRLLVTFPGGPTITYPFSKSHLSYNGAVVRYDRENTLWEDASISFHEEGTFFYFMGKPVLVSFPNGVIVVELTHTWQSESNGVVTKGNSYSAGRYIFLLHDDDRLEFVRTGPTDSKSSTFRAIYSIENQ